MIRWHYCAGYIVNMVWLFSAAYASPDTLDTHKTRLESTQLEIRTAEHNRQQAAKKLQAAKQQNAELRQTILDKAADIDRVERLVISQKRKIVRLEQEQQALQHALSQRRQHMSRLVSAAWSLQHRPQLAAWMLPKQTRERALTARSLHVTTVSLQQQLQDMQQLLVRQQSLQDDIATQRERNKARIASLKEERLALRKKLEERQRIVRDIQALQSRHMEKIATLTRDAANMQQLIIQLENARVRELAARFDDITPVGKPDYRYRPSSPARPDVTKADIQRKAASFQQAKGSLPLPVNGRIVGQFGARRGPNDRLKGVEIKALSEATVIAPYEGEILFTGDFLDYGKMVILRHNDDYHTLVAGLSRIDVARGQFLLDGEPIGAMGDSHATRMLYVELRRNSQAINPKPWFAALSSQRIDYAQDG